MCFHGNDPHSELRVDPPCIDVGKYATDRKASKHNAGPTLEMLGRCFTNAIQLFCVFWVEPGEGWFLNL